MKYKKQTGLTTQPKASQMSKIKTLFIDSSSATRGAIADKDVLVHGDVTGVCAYLLAKGHSKRLYGMIADVTISN